MAFPELYQELKDLQHKERGDRFRVLAMLGLYSLHNLSHNKKTSASTEDGLSSTEYSPNPIKDEVDKLKKTKRELKNRLLNSMGDNI